MLRLLRIGEPKIDRKMNHREDIQGLRAFAILLVVAAHAKIPGLSAGFIGVDMFFVISGYLITGLLLNEINNDGRISYGEFFYRRVKRLLPALITMVVIVSFASIFLLAPFEQDRQALSAKYALIWLSNFYFAFTHVGYFDTTSETDLFLHTWSLGVEEQFYLIWPFLLAAIAKLAGSRHSISLLIFGMLGLLLSIGMFHFNSDWAFYLMPARAWQFAAGGLMFVSYTHFKNKEIRVYERVVSRDTVALSGFFLVLIALLVVEKAGYPGLWALLPTLGTCLMLVGGRTGRERKSLFSRALSVPLTQWIGKISYSWYLWHWPVLVFGFSVLESDSILVRFTLVLFSLLLALISYYFVEAPARYGRLAFKKSRLFFLGSLGLCVGLFGIVGIWQSNIKDWNLSPKQLPYIKANNDLARIYADGCDGWITNHNLIACSYGKRDASKTVYLLGDSIGAQWFPAIEELFVGNDWNIVVLTKSSCPIIDEDFYYARLNRIYVECEGWRDAALDLIVKEKPEAVFIGNTRVNFNEEQWKSGTDRVIGKIAGNVGNIYIIQPTLALPFNGPYCQARWHWQNNFFTPLKSCSNYPDVKHVTNIGDWLRSIAMGYENVSVIDMNPYLCPDGVCQAERDGVILYRDQQHITASFAKSVAEQLGKQTRIEFN